jgi:hypothetical protein
MEELTGNVNWLAVIVGFVVSFLLGWLWYSPKLFGTKWAAGLGVDLGSASDMPVGAMATQAIGTFLLSWIVGITAGNNALATAILIVVTIVVLMAAGGMYTKKSQTAILIESGFVVSMAVVMIVVQGIF